MVKRGLIADPKHREAIGECLWLYLHILDRTDFDDGIAYDWKDSAEADAMKLPVETLRYQRRKLESKGYITAQKSQHKQQIIVHNWHNPRSYSGKATNTQSGNELQLSSDQAKNESCNESGNRLQVSDFESCNQSDNQSCNQSSNPLPPLSIHVSHVMNHDTHTHTGAQGARASAGSRFSLQDCRRYADHLKTTGQGIEKPGGYATSIFRSGEADSLIEDFLHAPRAPDLSQCPDCGGSGMVYLDTDDPSLGVKRCKHEKLKAEGGSNGQEKEKL
jgi:hypothetical protein